MLSQSESEALIRLRRLLAETDSLTVSGSLTAAEVKCREARKEMKRVGMLCVGGRPELQSEAEGLFAKLKVSVDRLERTQRAASKRSAAAAAAEYDAEQQSLTAATALEDDNPFSEANVKQSFRMQQQQLAHMKQREGAMDQVAKDMSDLNEIFCKLNELVREQGEKLTLIEDHVAEAEIQVVTGAEQLQDAVRKQRSSRKKKIIIICVVAAAVLLLALILYLVLSKLL